MSVATLRQEVVCQVSEGQGQAVVDTIGLAATPATEIYTAELNRHFVRITQYCGFQKLCSYVSVGCFFIVLVLTTKDKKHLHNFG